MKRMHCGGLGRWMYASLALAPSAVVCLSLAPPPAVGSAADTRQGGVAQLAFVSTDLDSLDPALVYSVAASYLVNTTCALLLTHAPRAHGLGSSLQPEVASRLPRVSRDLKTYTFTLRRDFRFSDGTPVRPSAFARAINRTLVPGMKSPWAAYTRDIVGAERVLKGKTEAAPGVVARGSTLVVRFKRPVPDFPAQTASYLCAVPPTLPADPEGVAVYPAAGPYYVAEYRPGERVVLRRNPFYAGKRPQHVDSFNVDLRLASQEEVLDRIESGDADWGWALPLAYFDPARRLVAKYVVNRSQFFVEPSSTFRGYAFNTSRPLFRDNPQLRRAVNFAIDRAALRRASGGEFSSKLADQYLPPSVAGFSDARIYPLEGPDLRRARALARGNTRGGPPYRLLQQVHGKGTIRPRLRNVDARLRRSLRRPEHPTRRAVHRSHELVPIRLAQIQPLASARALLQGVARLTAYGKLDVQLAREEAPMVAVDVFTSPTLVSKRVGCIGRTFDLASICLR